MMTTQEIFEAMLASPILKDKYKISKAQLAKTNLSENPEEDILAMMTLLVNAIENNMPTSSITALVKTRFKI